MNQNPETAAEEVKEQAAEETVAEETAAEATAEAPTEEASDLQTELDKAKEALSQQETQYQYLAAEYDNFRRRSAKEKTDAYSKAKGDAALAFLPVFDNLQRALAAPCADPAYAKGVEMTMTQLRQVLESLDITEIPALGEQFDPNMHNAVMHVDDESVGENTIVDVFQSGFRMGEKVIRFSMVKVAN